MECSASCEFGYIQLAASPIRLSILKMDSTSFDVRVASTASVLQLKQAIEATFGDDDDSQMQHPNISWAHVWENFCLSYNSHKLIDDLSLLSSFGIRDCDQLCFVRHISSRSREERFHPRKHGRFRVLRKKSSNGANVRGDTPLVQIELHWKHVLRTWFMYSKLWIMGVKQEWKNLHLQ